MNSNANKVKIAITTDSDLLTQIDEIAEARGESRSALITKMLRVGVDEQRKLLKQMENPLYRAVLGAMTKSPELLQKMSELVCENMTLDEAIEKKQNIEKQLQLGKQRATNKTK